LHATGTIACGLFLKNETKQIRQDGLKKYLASFWNVADLALIVLYLGAFLPLNYLHEDISFENEWRLVNIMLILLTFVKIN
jgi:hypothetical protein